MAQSTVKLIVDAQNAIAPLKRVNEQTKALSSSTDKLKGRLDRSNMSLKNTGKAAKTASAGVGTLVGALKPLLAALAVVGTARFVLFQTAQLETQTKALENLTGSAEKAQAIVQEIKEFGAVTPFKSSELIETTKLLKAFGFETENVVDITKRVADIAGTAGADIDRVAFAIGKVQAKNKFMQEENVMLLEKGVNIQKELQQVTGLTGDELAKAMSKGEVGANKFVEALVIATSEGGQFFKGAVNQSGTLAGKFSTLQDGIETLAQVVGARLQPALKSALDVAINLVTSVNQALAATSITDVDKKALKKQAETVVKEQTTFLERAAGGIPVVEIEFMGQIFKGQASSVQSQITNALINAEVAKRLKEQLEIQKKLANATKETTEPTKEIAEKTKETVTTIESQVTINDLFNSSLDQTSFLINDAALGSNKFADALVNVKSEADQLKEKFMEIGQGIEQGIVSNLTDAVMGTQTLAQAAINVLNQLKRKLVEVAIQRAVSGIGNFIGSGLGSIFGGGGSTNQFIGRASANAFRARANGGPVSAGGAFVVGEKGPELLQMGSRGGNIIPNNKLGGGTTNIVNVSVDASGSSVQGNDAEGQALGQLIASVVQTTIVQEQRAGGLLNR